jgi:hypothetical protein
VVIVIGVMIVLGLTELQRIPVPVKRIAVCAGDDGFERIARQGQRGGAATVGAEHVGRSGIA